MDGKVIMGLDDYNGLQNYINNLKNQLDKTGKFLDKYYKLADEFVKQEITCKISTYWVKNYKYDEFLDEENYLLRDEYKKCTEAGIDIDYCKKKVIEKYNEVKLKLEEEKEENDK